MTAGGSSVVGMLKSMSLDELEPLRCSDHNVYVRTLSGDIRWSYHFLQKRIPAEYRGGGIHVMLVRQKGLLPTL